MDGCGKRKPQFCLSSQGFTRQSWHRGGLAGGDPGEGTPTGNWRGVQAGAGPQLVDVPTLEREVKLLGAVKARGQQCDLGETVTEPSPGM